MILTSVGALSGLGLLMVLSASSVTSFEKSGNSYSIFLKQLLFLLIALVLAYAGGKINFSHWEKLARYSLFLGLVALILPTIPHIGKEINGNTNWVPVGPFLLQPSEFAKLALILYCALQLRRHELRIAKGRNSYALALVAPGTLGFIALILKGRDLGTATIVGGIVIGLLFISGVPLRYVLGLLGSGLLGAITLAISQPSRMHRFRAVLNPFDPAIYKFAGWQPAHSLMSLASGGIFGVGIGASKQKWANLTEAHTDFIFSVIGEEMGLIGALVVLILYGILLFAIFRVAIQSRDSFSKYAVTGIGCWFILQILVNLLTDVGIIPVIGVTLPFISYGGSSLIANFLGVAFVLNVARQEIEITSIPLNKRGTN
jgi:cell division protein FtsW